MADSVSELQERMRVLRVAYAEQLPEKIRQIEEACAGYQSRLDEEILHALHRMVHGLTGSGLTFGFAELGQVAHVLEEYLKNIVNRKSPANDDDFTEIHRQIAGLRQASMSLGGDDFLTKPIKPEHLVSSVTSRIQRSRLLRSFMVRDSLTGLLNHTAVKDHLEQEVARAKRQKTSLTYAMVDIDHFKLVNDTYGHPVGDRVIKSLSRLLKQRLRETDVVGRYGGEEFAVIMSNTDGHAAMKVLDEIRDAFSRLNHLADEKEFSVTFSCGIAEVALFGDAIKLGDSADKALYEAKHAGRNRVVLAHG